MSSEEYPAPVPHRLARGQGLHLLRLDQGREVRAQGGSGGPCHAIRDTARHPAGLEGADDDAPHLTPLRQAQGGKAGARRQWRHAARDLAPALFVGTELTCVCVGG